MHSVLMVTDGQLRAAGVTENLEDLLKKNGIKCTIYDKTRPNPTVENVETARLAYLANKCQCLIAFGGGSSMDFAKAVGARSVCSLYCRCFIYKILCRLYPCSCTFSWWTV